ADNPLFKMVPAWALSPLVVLATMASVIASQAVISGAFSLTRQAIQLGFLPRLRIEQTSARQIGQIYLPGVNWLLLASCIWLVVEFGSSSRLAAAYGLAVTSTMAVTTLLLYVYARDAWKVNAGSPSARRSSSSPSTSHSWARTSSRSPTAAGSRL
ncbi:MAG TPA: KUP/HAK/KT family potassium transporter, partial [Thermoanaerobaculia bacterium]